MALVFLDTNSINSTSLDTLFGQVDELAKLQAIAHIVLPEIVFDELIAHKQRYFEEERNKLLKSRLLSNFSVGREQLKELTFDSYREDMIQRNSIKYELASIQDSKAAMEQLYKLAIRNEAPFEKGSDKGFKDACVVITIDEYVRQHTEYSSVLLITKDNRMSEYFDSEECRVTTVKDIEAALKALAPRAGMEGTKTDEIRTCLLPETSKEQAEIKVGDLNAISALINELENSHSFFETHKIVDKYRCMDLNHLSSRDGRRILEACASNDQVSYILADNDIASFITPIFLQYQQNLDVAEYSIFVDALGLPNDRMDDSGNIILSRSEKEAYNNFTQGLVAHIQSRGFDSSISTDISWIEGQLDQLVILGSVDENAISWSRIASIFIKGDVTASGARVKVSVLKEFLSLLQHGSDAKASAIINAIAFRLGEIDQDYPF